MFKILAVSLFVAATISANPIDLKLQNEVIFTAEEPQGYRLPTNTIPLSYRILLRTDIHEPEITAAKFKFTGTVIIELRPTEATRAITLHQRQLTVLDAHLKDAGSFDVTWTAEQITYDAEKEFLQFTLPSGAEDLTAGSTYTLEINYEGVLREDNGGFYRSYYRQGDKEIYLATTQFEPTNARHAFPCYDEPGIRAAMTVVINHHKSYTTVSNQPIASKIDDPDDPERAITEFEPTPPVQTYLLAFVVSDFSYVGREIKDLVPQRVYARSEAIADDEGDFAVRAGIEILTDLERYLDTKYTLPKMDQISIPDFSAGAMENWGLVTYREELLLWNPEKSSQASKHRIATIIAHEYGHQFFGNLVAPEWWNYLWLNEGFATLYEYTTVSRVYPGFSSIDYMIRDAVQYALRADASEATRPMTSYAETPAGISALFDDIAYEKSGSVLRMWQHALTETVFVQGLHDYLAERGLNNANSDHLGVALNNAAQAAGVIPASMNFLDVVNSWSTKSGFPVVTVSREENGIKITQEKFGSESTDTWIIPISLTSMAKPDFATTTPKLWLQEGSETVTKTQLPWEKDDWVLANVQETGFYRVNYDADLWGLLVDQLTTDFEQIHYINRAQLIDDSMNLARAGYIKYDTAFEVIDYVHREREFLPWAAATNGLGFLYHLFLDSQVHPLLNRFIANKIDSVFNELGTRDGGASERLPDKTLRNTAIDWACLTGNTACIQETRALVRSVAEDKENQVVINADIRGSIYCNGLRDADSDIFTGMYTKIFNIENQAERTLLIQSLACTSVPEHQDLFLNSSVITDVGYRLQERSRVLQYTYLNGGGAGILSAISFIKLRWEDIRDVHGEGSLSAVKRPVTGMAERITTPLLRQEYEDLLDHLIEAEVFDEGEKKKLMATPDQNIKTRDERYEDLNRYFSEYFTGNANVPMISGLMLLLGFALVQVFNP